MKNAIYSLFPCPVMVCAKNHVFTDAEKTFIAELEMFDNTGNLMSKNDRILDCEELAGLRQFVEGQIHIYKKKLLHMQDENEIYITQSWANKSSTSQFHPKHKHPNSIISGVIFFDENDDESLPPIRFHRSAELFPLDFAFENLNEFTASCQSFETAQGRLMLFPSLVEHDVEQNRSDKVRTSISFNTYVRGVVGGKEQLTEVKIG